MLPQNTIFAVVITETLARTICIEAATQDEAIDEAQRLYRNEEIVLDYGDFVDVAFEVKADKEYEKVGQISLISINNLCAALSVAIEKHYGTSEAAELSALIEKLVKEYSSYIKLKT